MDATPEQLARRYFEDCIERGDFRALEELVEPAEFAAAAEGLRLMRVAFPDARVTINRVVSQASAVALHVTIQATHLGDWRNIPPTGKQVRYNSTVFFEVHRARLANADGVSDALGVWCQVQGSHRAYVARWWAAMAWFGLIGVCVGYAWAGGQGFLGLH